MQVPPRTLALCVTLVLACATGPAPVAPPVKVAVEQRYDRNALVASAVAGRFVVALTEAGSLLLFDRRTLAYRDEHWPARRAVAVAAEEDREDVLVGLSSGQIVRLDLATFAVKTVGEVPGVPVFIHRDRAADRTVVVFGKPTAGPYGWARRLLQDHRARALDGAWETPVDGPTTFLVDRQRRLWLGGDHGEWGGGIQVLDLASGRLTEVPWEDGGVYGLLERPDGEIWGFGGTSHMLISDGHVARVEPGKPPRTLYDHKLMWGVTYEAHEKQEKQLGRRPIGPISHLVALEGERLLMTSGSYVFETDARLKRWRRLATLKVDGPVGRPDAVGSYPAVHSWARVNGRLLLTTARDGLATFNPTTGMLRSYRLDSQPPSGETAMCGTEGHHPQWASIALDGRQVTVSDTLPLEAGQWLVALGSALVKYDAAAGRGSRLELPGLDGEVHRLARDEKGRIWLAGRGLWLLDGFTRAIDVLGGVPAAADTDVCALDARRSRLSLVFSERGEASVDADALAAAALGTGRTALAAEDRPRPHEPHFGDHAVFVSLIPPVPWPKSQSWENRFNQALPKVLSALDRGKVRAVLAEDSYDHTEPLIFYTSDTAGVIAVVEEVMRAESLWEHVRVVKRPGGQHLPEVLVHGAPPAPQRR